MRDRMFFDREMHNYLKQLSVDEFTESFIAICDYAFYDILPPEGSRAWFSVQMFKPKLDLYILAVDNKKARNCEQYKAWRTSVFTRDGFTCQICGKVGGKLNAHHIKHFSTHIDLRYCVENGITLCEKCHKEVHRRERKLRSIREIS